MKYRTKKPEVGAHKDVDSPFSVEEIRNHFKNYDIIELVEQEVELNESKYHNGRGCVIRFIGRK
nr:hypothetical protein [Allomuricauda sp.]